MPTLTNHWDPWALALGQSLPKPDKQNVAKRNHCWNMTKLHHKLYKPIKESTGLKTNHVCQAIRRVIGNSSEASPQVLS